MVIDEGVKMYAVDETTRAGRMLAAGNLTVTIRSKVTGDHITLTAKCKRKPERDGGRWQNASLADADFIFFSVPNAGGGWNDKVGKSYRSPRTGEVVFRSDPHADAKRVWCVNQLLAYAAGAETHRDAEIFEEDRCGKCGRALTDPVSIQRGIGPECYGQETGSQHEVKQTPAEKVESHPAFASFTPETRATIAANATEEEPF